MTKELSVESYCEVCGIAVDVNSNLKRFGMPFCSELHMNQYVAAKQKQMGISEQDNNNRLAEDGVYETEGQRNEEDEQQPRKRKRSWFREGCC